MNNKQRLELTWIGKNKELKIEPRILIEDPEKSYGDPSSGNMLIHGDNLLALKALEQEYTSKVKCVFLDPPYNTGSAFEHYDDGVEHSIWLNLMRPRLQIIKGLLSDSGSLWITIDDNEAHYLKVLCDEIFGRNNFICSIAWQKAFAKKNKALISGSHDHILVIAKDITKWKRNLLVREGAALSTFKNPDNDPRGPWQSVNYSVQSEDAEKRRPYRYPITLPSGREVMPPVGRHWNGLPERTEELRNEGRLWFGKDGNNPPRTKLFLSEAPDGVVPDTWWTHENTGSNQDSKKEMLILFPGIEPFSTPKPEKLLQRIISVATNEGDLVLDSFLGSGTTSAVAHKMSRRWIGIEMGEHAYTFCQQRMKKVVDGNDGLSLSNKMGWAGGGGFKFYELAPSLLIKDLLGNWVFDPRYNAHQLAEAVCKHEGFKFMPNDEVYWKQGKSTENDYIFVTTTFLTRAHLDRIYEELGKGESLLICSKSFDPELVDLYPEITIKKIPQSILLKAEFGRENYNLNIIENDETEEGLEELELEEEAV